MSSNCLRWLKISFINNFADRRTGLGPDVHLLELETGRDRVLVKHANRVERDFVEVFASDFD
jgi:hypothetical protein